MTRRIPKPVIGPITSKFGYRPPLPFHNGQDYGWLYADPDKSRRIYAPIGGKVTVGKNSLVGNHLFLPMGGGWRTRLCHFDSIAVRNGQTVRKGQYLGFMGNTGSQARGVHLHVDVYDPAGIRRNPAHYYTETFVLDMPGFAGGGSTPIPEEEEDMPQYTVFKRTDGTPEWMVLGTDILGPANASFPNGTKGRYVTTDPAIGLAMERAFAKGSGTANNVKRDEGYTAAQALFEALYDHTPKAANGPTDLNGVLNAVAGLPDATVQAFKTAL